MERRPRWLLQPVRSMSRCREGGGGQALCATNRVQTNKKSKLSAEGTSDGHGKALVAISRTLINQLNPEDRSRRALLSLDGGRLIGRVCVCVYVCVRVSTCVSLPKARQAQAGDGM